jgi:hypothetical protein
MVWHCFSRGIASSAVSIKCATNAASYTVMRQGLLTLVQTVSRHYFKYTRGRVHHGKIVHDILNKSSVVFTIVHDCIRLLFDPDVHCFTINRIVLSVGSMAGQRLGTSLRLLELGEELGCGALGRAVGEVED